MHRVIVLGEVALLQLFVTETALNLQSFVAAIVGDAPLALVGLVLLLLLLLLLLVALGLTLAFRSLCLLLLILPFVYHLLVSFEGALLHVLATLRAPDVG